MKTKVVSGLFLGLVAACGYGDGDEAESNGTPAPNVREDSSDEAFALEDGTYYIESLTALQDGCGKKPLESEDSITQVPFFLNNDGQGTVKIDFCSYQQAMTTGTIRGNKGKLHAYHNGRQMGSADYPAVMDQECIVELKVKSDNAFEGRYSETQRNRNLALREATVDVPECTTSFDFKMVRKD